MEWATSLAVIQDKTIAAKMPPHLARLTIDRDVQAIAVRAPPTRLRRHRKAKQEAPIVNVFVVPVSTGRMLVCPRSNQTRTSGPHWRARSLEATRLAAGGLHEDVSLNRDRRLLILRCASTLRHRDRQVVTVQLPRTIDHRSRSLAARAIPR